MSYSVALWHSKAVYNRLSYQSHRVPIDPTNQLAILGKEDFDRKLEMGLSTKYMTHSTLGEN